jgi:uncharacterized protein
MSDQSKTLTPPPDRREVRVFIEDIELRAAPAGSKSPGTLVGYAALYEKFSCDLGMFREKLARGCFEDCLKRCDVRCLGNHDPNLILGRTSAGTLKLSEDDRGLRMECDLPDTSHGRDWAESTRRRDVQGQSFSFTVAEGGDSWDWTGDTALRTVHRVDQLYDAGPVTFPAYEETSVALRHYRAQVEQRSKPSPAAAPAGPLEREQDLDRLRLIETS